MASTSILATSPLVVRFDEVDYNRRDSGFDPRMQGRRLFRHRGGIRMDPIAIFTVVGAVASIVSIVIYLLRPRPPVPPEPPSDKRPALSNAFATLNTIDASEHRDALTDRYRKYSIGKPSSLSHLLQPVVQGGLITDPMVPPPADMIALDCIGSIVYVEGRTIAILPSADSRPDVEGVGRTSLLVRLLGLSIPYHRLLGYPPGGTAGLPDVIPIFRRADPWCQLLACDATYIGILDGRLTAVPTKGEAVSFAWDLARHIFRLADLEYRRGEHRVSPGREKLCRIFERIPLADMADLFGRLDRWYPIDEIVLLKRRISHPEATPSIRVLSGDTLLQHVRGAMAVALKHGSLFWKRDGQALNAIVDAIVSDLHPNKLPTVSELTISHPSPIIPSHLFDASAHLIRTGKPPTVPDIESDITAGQGIAFHNELLYRRIHDVASIRILATSGEHLFRDVAFWKELSQVRQPLSLSIVLMDPECPAASERQRSAYRDKSPGFLHEEILENVGTIARMSSNFAGAGIPVTLCCRYHSHLPPFRMTFLGTDRVLVAPYGPTERTGFGTVFYEVTAKQEGSLFHGFNQLFNSVESSAKPVPFE